ncbi:MAG: hypothetical protein IH987_15230 [Planctomycetes bacterium]|nr:hypothetical protein [Planctomycetota bacterium]
MCDDNDACTTADTCSAGACVGGVPSDCDDGNICMDDPCDSASGCGNTNNTASCNDNDDCTVGDVCAAGTCEVIADHIRSISGGFSMQT